MELNRKYYTILDFSRTKRGWIQYNIKKDEDLFKERCGYRPTWTLALASSEVFAAGAVPLESAGGNGRGKGHPTTMDPF